MSARALIVAAPASGAGKTTVTLGLVRALARRGVHVRAAKSGPDYIDAGFHALAGGAGGVNLDSWAMPPALLDSVFTEAAQDVELLLIEGAMGLFDGAPVQAGPSGATADLAAHFALPVVLVMDVAKQAQTAAAVLRGLATHDPAVRIAGVVLNRVGSERHRALVCDAIEKLAIPVLGALPRDASLELPSRHLGLVQAGEHADWAARLERIADALERHVDLELLLALSAPAAPRSAVAQSGCALPAPGRRIALARDAAFSFVYPHVLSGWQRAGCEIVPFSPLADEAPPESCDSCWLPGGYPELHAAALAAAASFREGLRRFARTRPVHGECGGYMVLGEVLEDADRVRHRMTGLLSHATSFAQRRLHLGYREAILRADGALGTKGARVRGHEFHYATQCEPGHDAPLADLADARGQSLGPAGGARGQVTGSFFHGIAARSAAR